MGRKDRKSLNEEFSKIRQLLETGKVREAIDQFRNLEKLNRPDLGILTSGSGLFINAGLDLLDSSTMIREGIRRADEALGLAKVGSKHSAILLFNKANAYCDLWSLRRMSKDFEPQWEDQDLQDAKANYRELLKGPVENRDLEKQAWVNFGNCLDSIGRSTEALECYDRALAIETNFPMALGNKGMALVFFSEISGEHRGLLLREAYDLLSRALAQQKELQKCGGPGAIQRFEGYQQRIATYFRDKKDLEKPLRLRQREFRYKSKLEKSYCNFCARNRLFLNFCLGCTKCKKGISDPIFFKSLVLPIDDKHTFDCLAKYFNQIKEDYATARWLLFQSEQVTPRLDRISKITSYANTLDYSFFDIYSGMLKTAFEEAADILDKVANFINEYLKLGVASEKVCFTNVWFNNRKERKLRPTIEPLLNNHALRALYDLYLDWDVNGHYRPLRDVRNALTHRYLATQDFVGTDVEEQQIYVEDLKRMTLDMLRIAKNAIIYLACVVKFEEEKRHKNEKGSIPPLFFSFDQIPGYRTKD